MKQLMAVVTLAAIGSACGSSPATSTASPSPSAAVPSPSPPPSPLSFKLNGIKTTASGTITLIAEPHSVSIELKITGLQPNSSHVSHIHIGSCQQVGNISLALNQVVADGNGDADTKSTLTASYPPVSGTWYVVVHAGPDMQGTNASYLL
ncbi:MAG: CHRD domain-containing protein [Chloroflexi bacterium]|nr:MAG: CHRD domain-containing protein [Chloroflexota bacterium]